MLAIQLRTLIGIGETITASYDTTSIKIKIILLFNLKHPNIMPFLHARPESETEVRGCTRSYHHGHTLAAELPRKVHVKIYMLTNTLITRNRYGIRKRHYVIIVKCHDAIGNYLYTNI